MASGWTSGLNSEIFTLDKIKELFLDEKTNAATIKILEEIEEKAKKAGDSLDENDKKLADTMKKYREYAETVRAYGDVVEKLDKTYAGLEETLNAIRKSEKERQNSLKTLTQLTNDAKEATRENRKELMNIAAAYADATGNGKKFSSMMHDEIRNGISSIGKGITDIFSSIKNFGNDLMGPWAKADQAASKFAKSLGMSGAQMQNLRHNTIAFARDSGIGIKYNKSIEELLALQKSYADQTGRNILLTDKQKESMAAMSAVMGDEAATALAGKLENFGIGLEKAGDMAGKMFNEANEHGISFEKYTKTVTDNLTMVQQYGFKNGIQGLTTMARKATEMKLDMQQVANFAEKINTVEGAISTAANLQVLGGPFATMGSDPMTMLYEGLNDMEALQDRIIGMYSGLGTFNKATGQVETSNFDKVRIREAAKSMGIDSKEIFQMINRAGVRNEIQQQIAGKAGVNDKILDYLSNAATFNGKGEAVIDIGNGEQRISDLDLTDKKTLDKLTAINNNESQDIKDIATRLRGWEDVMQGIKKQFDITQASLIEGDDANNNLGNTVKSIASKIGETNTLLKTIAIGMLAFKGIGAIASMVGGGRTIAQGWRGMSTGFSGLRSLSKAGKPMTSAAGGTVYKTSGGLVEARMTKGGLRYYSKDVNTGKLTQIKNAKGAELVKDSSALRGGGNIAKFMAGNAGKMLGGAALGGAITGIVHAAAGDFKKSVTKEGRENKTKAIGDTIGATIGGAVGSLLGPIGAIAVGALGSWVGGKIGGAISKSQTKKRDEAKTAVVQSFGGLKDERGLAVASLSGDYSQKEMEMIKKAYSDGRVETAELNDKLLEKMAKSGDISKLKGLEEVFRQSNVAGKVNLDNQEATIAQGIYNVDNATFKGDFGEKRAGGGPVEGPPHSSGGVHMELEGGEFVINKESVAKYSKSTIEKINAGTLEISRGVESPMAGIKPMVVVPTPEPTRQSSQSGIGKLEISPIKVKFEGSIRLDAGSQSVDVTSLINNKDFVTQFSQMISRQIEDNLQGGYFKDDRKNKFPTF